MDSKLTLKLDEHIIARAKKYAANKKLSLSRLVEMYLDSLTNDKMDDFEISAFVKSIANGKQIPNDIEEDILKNDRIDYLDEKHK